MTDETRAAVDAGPAVPAANARGEGLALHVGAVSAATCRSRILGLLRDQVIAGWFGASATSHA